MESAFRLKNIDLSERTPIDILQFHPKEYLNSYAQGALIAKMTKILEQIVDNEVMVQTITRSTVSNRKLLLPRVILIISSYCEIMVGTYVNHYHLLRGVAGVILNSNISK